MKSFEKSLLAIPRNWTIITITASLLEPYWFHNVDSSSNRVNWFSHDVNVADLIPGDHIYAHRCFGLYDHHGIYIGENDVEVIHFVRNIPTSGLVEGCSLRHFLDGEKVRLVAYNISPLAQFFKMRPGAHYGIFVNCHQPATVVETAKTYLHNPVLWIREHGSYDLYSNNCEHFAHYCKTSQYCSKQSSHGRSTFDIATDIIFPPKLIYNAPKYVRQIVVKTASCGANASS